MRLYIIKSVGMLSIYKESLLISIISDLFSFIVMTGLLIAYGLFIKFVGHFIVLDIFFCLLYVIFISALLNFKSKVMKKPEEVFDEVKNFIIEGE